MRVPTLYTTREAFAAIEARQNDQARLQDQIASGLRVRTPGEDPVAAAQAEMARSRLARLEQDQRATTLATSTLSTADAALARGIEELQSAREGLVAAGNGSYGASDRATLAMKLASIRGAMLDIANSRDGAGGYVFGGQGSAGEPVTGKVAPQYGPASGVLAIGEGGRYQATVDGLATFMNVPQGNGVFTTASDVANTGTGWIEPGSVGDPAALTGRSYEVVIAGAPGAQTYTVQYTDAPVGVAVGATPFTPDAVITVEGQRFRIGGAPANGDRFTVAPSGSRNVFETLDEAVALLKDPNVAPNAYAEQLQRVQTTVDRALDAMIMMRTRVGEQLRGVDSAAAVNEDQSVAVAQRRSDLEDLDVADAVSQLANASTRMEAAIKSYSMVSKTSLFQILG